MKKGKCAIKNIFVFTGIDEISEDVCKGVDHSDSEDSEKSDSSDSEYLSDEEHKPKSSNQDDKDKAERKWPKASTDGDTKDGVTAKAAPETLLKDKQASNGPERDLQDKPVTPQSLPATEKPKAPEEGRAPAAKSAAEQDSDSERELVIDLGDEQGGHESKKARRDAGASTAKPSKESNVAKVEGEPLGLLTSVAMFGRSNIRNNLSFHSSKNIHYSFVNDLSLFLVCILNSRHVLLLQCCF